MKQIKENWLILSIALFSVVFSVIYPDFYIKINGGFAYYSLFLGLAFGIILCIIGIFGGSFSIESNGLLGWIKELRNKSK